MTKEIDLSGLDKVVPCRWKIQSISRHKPIATCVSYIDARAAEDLLDEVCGKENWQDCYKEINGKLFCGIGIKVRDEWVWKWDTGTEGEYEKDKSIASDAFKRALVKWGGGRFLYSMKEQYVKTNEPKTDNNKPYPVDNQGKRIYDLTEYFKTSIKPKEGSSQENTTVTTVCKVCQTGIDQKTSGFSSSHYGLPLCKKHQSQAQNTTETISQEAGCIKPFLEAAGGVGALFILYTENGVPQNVRPLIKYLSAVAKSKGLDINQISNDAIKPHFNIESRNELLIKQWIQIMKALNFDNDLFALWANEDRKPDSTDDSNEGEIPF